MTFAALGLKTANILSASLETPIKAQNTFNEFWIDVGKTPSPHY